MTKPPALSNDVRIRRVYDPPESDDGRRILVDRLWPRGLTRDRAAIDLWLKDVAPSSELRKWFDHDPDKWEEFRRRYSAELADRPSEVAQLRDALRQGAVTLLYAARDTAHNHALVLGDILRDGDRASGETRRWIAGQLAPRWKHHG